MQMGFPKGLASLLAILLLLFLLLAISSTPDRSTAYGSFRTGPATHRLGSRESHGGQERAKNEDGDAILGDEKRRVYTGPNPLHNR
ncbi:hypothetical protein Tsubulata_007857 [Turnera subulata]|uniref:Uncharacterized protein n=1 Tax=Turnera subulata TaxID=218843 RepID=A0A9Q0GF86_9ROSI|nr:hypothetical protein Tsubulata_007857 [Turnera subulata]